jgi:long-chain acyl-CoA synthetase
MPIYEEKPWLNLYDPGQSAGIGLEFTDALAMFRASVGRNPDGDAIRYFGGRITARARGRPAAGKCRARVRK